MFDGVLVDAPCSGIGTWQRNPHARWTTQPQDVRELAAMQKQLLTSVAPSLKAGGKLIYAVCSPARAETIEVVAEFEQKFDHFSPMPFANPLIPGSTPSVQLLLHPEETGGNAMFIAAWERRGV
jgi:16S rRNA (cytosine967-C5)-methyltransferase